MTQAKNALKSVEAIRSTDGEISEALIRAEGALAGAVILHEYMYAEEQ